MTNGPEHPIAIEPTAGRVIVRLGGRIVADSRNALTMRECDYPPVQYVPRSDVNMSLLERTTYENPYSAVAEIKEYLAFYPDRFDSIEID
jgi:uncharacterized protein (DUF427 family)